MPEDARSRQSAVFGENVAVGGVATILTHTKALDKVIHKERIMIAEVELMASAVGRHGNLVG